MEYNVMRLYADGCRLSKHVRIAEMRRGRLTVAQERLDGQRALVLVARLIVSNPSLGIPPIHNVTLVGVSSQAWMLRGVEMLESGPMRKACMLGQAWVVEPAPVQDLIDAETKWASAVREVNALKEQLRLVTGTNPAHDPNTLGA